MPLMESQEERRARYKRLAIAAAAAAARSHLPEVRTAYLLLAESWSDLAETDEPDSLDERGCGDFTASGSVQVAQDLRTGRDDSRPEKH